MKLQDAITLGENTAKMLRSSSVLQGIELDQNTLRTIEIIETLVEHCKNTLPKIKGGLN